MLAARYYPGKTKLVLEEIDKPAPGPGEVLLKIRAAGICHSDLHILDGEIPFENPFTMGHEACGELVKLGSGIPEFVKKDLELGRLYVVHGPNPGGNCDYCRSGHDNLCNEPERTWVGIGVDGAYAEFLKVPARNIIPVPEGISPEVAAVATDAVLTPYHAIKTLAGVRTGDTVLCIGLGGLGLNGVQIARALGAHVIAADVRDSALQQARTFGAAETLRSKDLLETLKGRKVDVVADFVGREETFEQAQQLVRPGGNILLIGLGAEHVPLKPLTAASYEIRVQGSFWGTSTELRELLTEIAEGKVRPPVETAPLRDIAHWVEELRAGRLRSRIAVLPFAAEAKKHRVA